MWVEVKRVEIKIDNFFFFDLSRNDWRVSFEENCRALLCEMGFQIFERVFRTKDSLRLWNASCAPMACVGQQQLR